MRCLAWIRSRRGWRPETGCSRRRLGKGGANRIAGDGLDSGICRNDGVVLVIPGSGFRGNDGSERLERRAVFSKVALVVDIRSLTVAALKKNGGQ